MGRSFDKARLVTMLADKLRAELERSTNRAADAADSATHEENRSESDKDMRSTEASYIARGHAERSAQLELSLKRLASMPVRDFAAGDAIEVSAVVELSHNGRRTQYFLVPAAGGERLQVDGVELLTLTTASPLGSALLGLAEGDEAEQGTRSYVIERVS